MVVCSTGHGVGRYLTKCPEARSGGYAVPFSFGNAVASRSDSIESRLRLRSPGDVALGLVQRDGRVERLGGVFVPPCSS